MKPKRFLLLFALIFAAMLLSACGVQTSSWPGLTADGDVAYLAAGNFVYSVRLSDGAELWRYENGAMQFIAQPVVAEDGTVLVGSTGSQHYLIALDGSTNPPQKKWEFTQAKNNWVASPLVLDGKVFAPNADGNLYVLNLQSNGAAIQTALAKIELGGALWAQPVTDGNLVYVTSVDHKLYAIDPVSYEFAWPAVELGGAAPGSPLVGPDGQIYVGSFASQVIKVDPATGQTTPFATTEDWVWGGGALDNDTIYVGDLQGYLYAFDAANGTQNWRQKPDEAIVGSPLVMTDIIVITTESGSVYAYNRDGSLVWQREVGGQVYTAPVSGTDLILVAPLQAEFLLTAYDTNGNQVWTFAPEN